LDDKLSLPQCPKEQKKIFSRSGAEARRKKEEKEQVDRMHGMRRISSSLFLKDHVHPVEILPLKL